MLRVLLVEPDRHFAELLTDALAAVAEVNVVRSAQLAIDWLDQPKQRCDVIICELALGAHSGVEVIHELRSHADWLALPIIIHSRVPKLPALSLTVLQEEYGVVDYIQKGQHSVQLVQDHLLALRPA